MEEQQTAQPNSGATGALTGTAQVGETLTADTSGIVDADGLDTATFSYQWRADDVAIQDATGSGYTLSEDDAGKAITVTASPTTRVTRRVAPARPRRQWQPLPTTGPPARRQSPARPR